MKAFSKLSVLLVVALLATAAVAASAQAQSINPTGPVSGVADFPFLDYEGVPVICDTGTADGTADGSDRIADLALEFFGNCGVAGVLPAEVDCDGTVSLIAQNAVANTGTVDLNEDFICNVTTDLCIITVQGPQTTQNGNTTLTGEDRAIRSSSRTWTSKRRTTAATSADRPRAPAASRPCTT